MKRKDFLKIIGTVLGISIIAPTLAIKTFTKTQEKNIDNDFIIDADGNIRYIGVTNKEITVLSFHRWLQDKSEKANKPSFRYTNNIIELHQPYKADKSTIQHLTNGTLIQTRNGKREEYFSVSNW